jgi:hypothetical protein
VVEGTYLKRRAGGCQAHARLYLTGRYPLSASAIGAPDQLQERATTILWWLSGSSAKYQQLTGWTLRVMTDDACLLDWQTRRGVVARVKRRHRYRFVALLAGVGDIHINESPGGVRPIVAGYAILVGTCDGVKRQWVGLTARLFALEFRSNRGSRACSAPGRMAVGVGALLHGI